MRLKRRSPKAVRRYRAYARSRLRQVISRNYSWLQAGSWQTPPIPINSRQLSIYWKKENGTTCLRRRRTKSAGSHSKSCETRITTHKQAASKPRFDTEITNFASAFAMTEKV